MTWDKVIKALAAMGGAIAGLFGGWDTLLFVLLGLMAVDYLSGVLVAFLGKSQKTEGGGLDSKVGAKGIAKKGLMMLVVLVASLLDKALGTEQQVFRTAVCWFYICNEGLSLLENLTLAGVPFPETMKKALEQLREKKSDQEKNTEA